MKSDGVLLNNVMICYLLQEFHNHAFKAGLVELNQFVFV